MKRVTIKVDDTKINGVNALLDMLKTLGIIKEYTYNQDLSIKNLNIIREGTKLGVKINERNYINGSTEPNRK